MVETRMSGITAAGARLTFLLAAVVAGPTLAADDLATPPFPANLQHEVVSRWIKGSTDLPAGAPLVFGSDAVAAILSNTQKGSDRSVRAVTFREEATAANFVTRMGGRSISGGADVDCKARSVKLDELTIYAGSNLKGREVSHMGARTDWRVPTPDRVLSRVVQGACGAAKPLTVAVAGPVPPPASAPASGLKPAVSAADTPAPPKPAPRPLSKPATAKPAPPPPALRPAAPAPPPSRPAAPPAVAKASPSPARPAPPAPVPAGGGVRVQIGAVSSPEVASREWDRIARQFPDAFKGHSKGSMKVSANGAELHRVLVGGFASKAAAQSFCGVLQAKGQACFIRN
jgi:cell division septation protein DedD